MAGFDTPALLYWRGEVKDVKRHLLPLRWIALTWKLFYEDLSGEDREAVGQAWGL